MDQNNCHDLKVEYLHSPDLDLLVKSQMRLQQRIDPNFHHPDESLASIAEFLMKNKHALEEEINETLNALGGTHDGIGSAAWKWWKKDNQKAKEMKISDLSERDLLELKYEIVDQFHFFMNQMIKVGMTGSELFSLYFTKNKENFNRQENGY